MAKILHTVRANDGSLIEVKINKGLAIKLMCTECMGFDENPSECTAKNCPLYPYRKKTHLAYIKKNKNEPDEIEPEEEEENDFDTTFMPCV